MKVPKRRKREVATLLLAALLLPSMAMAQQGGGLFGRGSEAEPNTSRGLMSGATGGFNLSNQHFGSDQNGGYELNNQTFGQDEEGPLGSGWLILAAAGAGYAAMKTRKKNKSKTSKKERDNR